MQTTANFGLGREARAQLAYDIRHDTLFFWDVIFPCIKQIEETIDQGNIVGAKRAIAEDVHAWVRRNAVFEHEEGPTMQQRSRTVSYMGTCVLRQYFHRTDGSLLKDKVPPRPNRHGLGSAESVELEGAAGSHPEFEDKWMRKMQRISAMYGEPMLTAQQVKRSVNYPVQAEAASVMAMGDMLDGRKLHPWQGLGVSETLLMGVDYSKMEMKILKSRGETDMFGVQKFKRQDLINKFEENLKAIKEHITKVEAAGKEKLQGAMAKFLEDGKSVIVEIPKASTAMRDALQNAINVLSLMTEDIIEIGAGNGMDTFVSTITGLINAQEACVETRKVNISAA